MAEKTSNKKAATKKASTEKVAPAKTIAAKAAPAEEVVAPPAETVTTETASAEIRKRSEIEEQFSADVSDTKPEVEQDASMIGRYAGQVVVQDEKPHSSGRILKTDMQEGVTGAWSQSLEGDDAADIHAQEEANNKS